MPSISLHKSGKFTNFMKKSRFEFTSKHPTNGWNICVGSIFQNYSDLTMFAVLSMRVLWQGRDALPARIHQYWFRFTYVIAHLIGRMQLAIFSDSSMRNWQTNQRPYISWNCFGQWTIYIRIRMAIYNDYERLMLNCFFFLYGIEFVGSFGVSFIGDARTIKKKWNSLWFCRTTNERKNDTHTHTIFAFN